MGLVMEAHKPRPKMGPEAIIQRDIVAFLRARGWWVMETHGNLYQSGFPDLYLFCAKYRMKWVEVKNPLKYKFEMSQLHNFPHMGPVWVMTAATEAEYKKLFLPPNWTTYLSCMK